MSRPYGSRAHDYNHVYDCIVEYKCSHDGNSPTIREIADICNITSTSVITYMLQALQFEGKIEVAPSKTRSIKVIGGQWIPPSD